MNVLVTGNVGFIGFHTANRLLERDKYTQELTYVGDIVEDVLRASDQPAQSDPSWSSDNLGQSTSAAPWHLFNIGKNPVTLEAYVNVLEAALGTTAKRELLPLQPGGVPDAYADSIAMKVVVGYLPATPLEDGVGRFVEWYRGYYG